jgi:hypothetical protein
MKRAVGVVMMLCGLLVNTYGQKPAVVLSNEPGWHKIGEISASFELETEAIAVLGADRFKSIKLRVTDASINIDRVQVMYEDGQIEDIDVKNELAEGSETRVIDLAYPTSDISKVAFTYSTIPNQEDDNAEIELYGFKTEQQGSNAYRDNNDADETGSEVERDAEQTGREVENDVEETGREIEREVNETGREINEEAREEKQEIREENREAKQEMREEKREMKRDAERIEDDSEDGVDKVGDDISEAAGNVGAEIKDKPYVDKVGPDGQRIYMDRHSKYYYIDDEGKKIFITKAQMKDNPKKD